MITEENLAEAIDRIARTSDGALLYRYLQKVLMGVLVNPNPLHGALPAHEGKRTFAAELMSLMSKGIEESAGRNSTEQPVVFTVREPARIAARSGFRAFARANDPELQPLTVNTPDAIPDPDSAA
jgi:hypothetical protein